MEGEGSGPPSFLHGSPSDSVEGSTLVHSMHLGGMSGEFLSAKDLINSRRDPERRMTLQHKKGDYINSGRGKRLSDMGDG